MGYLEFCDLLQCTGKGPPCTGLLDDPEYVLADRRRWPSHICYDTLRWSTEVWARDTKINVYPSDDAIGQWQGAWPLPIGRQALEHDLSTRYCEDRDYLLNLVPFDGEEEALWALRVEKEGAVLDLFGLAHYRTDGEIKVGYDVIWDEADDLHMRVHGHPHRHECEVVALEDGANGHRVAVVHLIAGMTEKVPVDQLKLRRDSVPISMGGLAWVLGGQDLSLVDTASHAKLWWAGLSGQGVRLGRPKGAGGAFPSVKHFERALRQAVRDRRAQGEDVTQEKLADCMSCDLSTLKRWLKKASLSWEDVKDS